MNDNPQELAAPQELATLPAPSPGLKLLTFHREDSKLDIPVEKVLDGARAAGLKEIIIIGTTADDEAYYASSMADKPLILYLLKCLEHAMFDGTY